MGRDIPGDDVRGRAAHVLDAGGSRFRANAPGWTEEQCDAMLASGARVPP